MVGILGADEKPVFSESDRRADAVRAAYAGTVARLSGRGYLMTTARYAPLALAGRDQVVATFANTVLRVVVATLDAAAATRRDAERAARQVAKQRRRA